MGKSTWVPLFVGLVAGAALALACGGARDLCKDKNVRCQSPLLCDPVDGVCKCGGRGGVVCPEGFVCASELNACVTTKCEGKVCAAGTSCDIADGECKCGGTGGMVCGAGELCDPVAKRCAPILDCNQVACPRNEYCDGATGRCLCGGAPCEPGKACSLGAGGARTCVADPCSATTCAGATVCDPADGFCKCGGVMCQSGESCLCPPGVDAGTCGVSARICRPSTACTNVTCAGGATCDPTDGLCKCGTVPGGPVCSGDQICSPPPLAQCQGGAKCSEADGGAKVCAGGTSCDAEDGLCKCGGRGGQVCALASGGDPAQVCVANSLQQSCKRPCDPRNQDCPSGEYCYYDPTAAVPVSYCAIPSDSRTEGQSCQTATACFATQPASIALHCTGLAMGQSGLCRSYCDTTKAGVDCPQVPTAHVCTQIQDAPAGLGYCQPQ